MNKEEKIIMLRSLSVGSRISFLRQLRGMTQQELGNEIGIKGKKARNIICRYERTGRIPRNNVLEKIATVLDVNLNFIKKYDFSDPMDIYYLMIWSEELCSEFVCTMTDSISVSNVAQSIISKRYKDWYRARRKYKKKEITREDYLKWKFGLEDG